MYTRRGIFSILTSLFALALVSTTNQNARASVIAGEYLVKYRSQLLLNSTFNSRDFVVREQHLSGKLLKIQTLGQSSLPALVELASDPNIEYFVPNRVIQKFFQGPYREDFVSSEQVNLREQYALEKVAARKAWELAQNLGSRGIIVAVIDTGVDHRHPALAPNMVAGYDFVQNDTDPMDDTSFQNPGHGTHCAGVIGATGLIANGIIGISPEVSLMPIRFLGANGKGDLMNAIKSIDFAIEKGAHVISASWGAKISAQDARPLIEAVQRSRDAGLTFVAAAGNDGADNDRVDFFPTNAPFDNVIAVAASNRVDAKPGFSNFGSARVHIAAPGENIMSTLPRERYGNLSGTSMAAPMISGLIALLLAQDPELSPSQLRSLIQVTGDRVNINTACHCRVNAAKAIEIIMNRSMFVSPAAGTFQVGTKFQAEAVYAQGSVSWSSSNPQVLSVDNKGEVSARSAGEAQLQATDSSGRTAKSLNIFVVSSGSSNPPGQPSPTEPSQPKPPGGGKECPFGSPSICEQLCAVNPALPFCRN
jgi:thermitase